MSKSILKMRQSFLALDKQVKEFGRKQSYNKNMP